MSIDCDLLTIQLAEIIKKLEQETKELKTRIKTLEDYLHINDPLDDFSAKEGTDLIREIL